MLRRTVVTVACLLALAACGARSKPPTAAGPSTSADTRTAAQRAEDTFIGTTAAHLCNVQSTVYDDPAALAAAYGSAPPYPGLDAAQVATFQKRLTTDAVFSARLTRQLQKACHPVQR